MRARWRTAAAVAACVVACSVPAVAAPAVPGCPGRDATGADAWTTIRPSFGGKSGANVVDMAVVPLNPDVIYATDGKTVSLTRDGGCTWRDLTASGALPAVASREVVAIDVSARSSDGVTTVWILSNVSLGPVSRPEVLVAEDGDTVATDPREWSLGALPLGVPPAGEAVTLAAGTDPEYAYVVISVPGAGRQLLATQNRGQLWEQRAVSVASDLRGVVADSVYPNLLWTWGLDGLFHSRDGGQTLEPVEAVAGPVADVGVAQSPKGTRILVLQPNGVLWRSDDGGATYKDTRVDVRTMHVAVVPVQDVAAAAGRGLVTVFPATFSPYDLSPRGEVWVDDLAAALDGTKAFLVARTQDVLRVREVEIDRAPVVDVPRGPDGAPLVSLKGPVRRIPLYPSLNPSRGVVSLAPGQTRDVEYRLEIPATPTPVDVHFVVDTTGSMGSVIAALRLALGKIVNDLTVAGIEAQFGVGDFRDVPAGSWGSSGDHIYKLHRGIGPVDEELEAALNALQAGGGGDGPESRDFALYEAVRHAAGKPTFLPEPEGDTGFRPGALKIAVVATDTTSHHAGEPDSFEELVYPGPDYEQLVAALHKARVRVMGISSNSQAKGSLNEVAYDSGAVAPEAGIDCNGDGRIDLPEGEPLVCDFVPGAGSNVPVPTPVDPILGQNGAKNMSSAILAMVRGVQDPATVAVRSSAPAVARVLTPPRVLDMKTPNALPVKVRYTCTADRYGTTTAVRLPAFAAGRQLAQATSEVRCGTPPPPAPDIIVPPAVPRVVAVAAAPPPPPPPAPVSNVNPNPNPNPNPQANLNLQAGLSAEEQQVPQLALVWNENELAEQESLAMSRGDDPVPAAALLCAGVMMAGAAYGLAHRRRTQVERASC